MNKDLWKLQIAFAAYQVFFRSIIDLCVCNNKQPCAKSYRSENIDVRDVALKGLIGELRIRCVWRYGIQVTTALTDISTWYTWSSGDGEYFSLWEDGLRQEEKMLCCSLKGRCVFPCRWEVWHRGHFRRGWGVG